MHAAEVSLGLWCSDFERDLREMRSAPFVGDTVNCMELKEPACCDTLDEMDLGRKDFRLGPYTVSNIGLSEVAVALASPSLAFDLLALLSVLFLHVLT